MFIVFCCRLWLIHLIHAEKRDAVSCEIVTEYDGAYNCPIELESKSYSISLEKKRKSIPVSILVVHEIIC